MVAAGLSDSVARAMIKRVEIVGYELLDKLRTAVSEADAVREETITREVRPNGSEVIHKTTGLKRSKLVDKQGVKQLASALKDLNDVLRSFVPADDDDGTVRFVLSDEAADLAD